MDDGKEEIQLDLDQDTLDGLHKLMVERDETLDECVEYILRLAIDRAETQS
jgi:hypothetical protein